MLRKTLAFLQHQLHLAFIFFLLMTDILAYISPCVYLWWRNIREQIKHETKANAC